MKTLQNWCEFRQWEAEYRGLVDPVSAVDDGFVREWTPSQIGKEYVEEEFHEKNCTLPEG